MSTFTETEKLKADVELKAWKALDTFFGENGKDIGKSKEQESDEASYRKTEKAKIAVGVLAIRVKEQQLEMNERRLLGPAKKEK
jgi:hypothetical protein